MKKIGVMGCGTVASYGHFPAIQQTPGLELTAVYDPIESAVRTAKEHFHVPLAFNCVEDFFSSDIDAVVVTSPAPCHYRNVVDASRYGKHILCEKPLGMNDAEIQEMIDTAAEAGVMLFTGFDYRFSPIAQTIKNLVSQEAVGQVRSLRLIYIWNVHGKFVEVDGKKMLSPRRVGRMEEGGPMVDCGVHQIDLARWWTESEVIRWTASGAWVDEYPAPDHLYLHMDHENGAHTMVEMSYSYCYTCAQPLSHFTYQLIGTDGLIRFDREAGVFEVRNSVGTQNYPIASEKNFHGMYRAFAEALETGSSDVLPTGYDGLMATKIARTATEEVMSKRLPNK